MKIRSPIRRLTTGVCLETTLFLTQNKIKNKLSIFYYLLHHHIMLTHYFDLSTVLHARTYDATRKKYFQIILPWFLFCGSVSNFLKSVSSLTVCRFAYIAMGFATSYWNLFDLNFNIILKSTHFNSNTNL